MDLMKQQVPPIFSTLGYLAPPTKETFRQGANTESKAKRCKVDPCEEASESMKQLVLEGFCLDLCATEADVQRLAKYVAWRCNYRVCV